MRRGARNAGDFFWGGPIAERQIGKVISHDRSISQGFLMRRDEPRRWGSQGKEFPTITAYPEDF